MKGGHANAMERLRADLTLTKEPDPDDDDDEDDGDEKAYDQSSSEEEELREQLADIPFEELQKARCDGREATFSKSKLKTKPSRANKNRPMEMSSKKPVGRLREVLQGPKKVVRDPRFESLCGNFDEGRFKKLYNFVFDEELPAERQKLQKMLKSAKDPKVFEEITAHISWIDNQLRKGKENKTQSAILVEHKKKEKEAVKQGKRPFYLKKSELRKQELMEKYESLKANGKLEAFLAKRRRKNAAKDHRYVPYRRL